MASRDSQFQVMVLYIFLRFSYHNDINLSHDHLGRPPSPSLHAFHLIPMNFSMHLYLPRIDFLNIKSNKSFEKHIL